MLRLDEHSLVQLGQGSRQKRIRASITSQTSHIGVESARQQSLTKSLLVGAGLPAPARSRSSTGATKPCARPRGCGFRW